MRRGCWVSVCLLALLPSGGLAGQGGPTTIVVVPFDLAQGALTNVDGATPYIASAKLQVAVGFGRGGPVRVGPVAAVRFANPDWAAAAGVRAQWLPFRFGLGGRRWGVGVVAEQLWDTSDGRPASAGLMGDLELVRLGAWLVHDWSDERTGFELSAGTDLRSLFAVLFPAEDPDPFEDIP